MPSPLISIDGFVQVPVSCRVTEYQLAIAIRQSYYAEYVASLIVAAQIRGYKAVQPNIGASTRCR